VLRTAPFVGLVYRLLVAWFVEGVATSSLGTPPERPWYPHKRRLCFADVWLEKTPANGPLDRAA
jgi:hypothetical protein